MDKVKKTSDSEVRTDFHISDASSREKESRNMDSDPSSGILNT
jgi:hypothetical protein